MRNRIFISFDEGNAAIRESLGKLNGKPFHKLEGNRCSLHEKLGPALKRLPPRRYEFARWKKARVNIDYYVEVEKKHYSVSYRLVKEQVDVCLTGSAVEILHKGKRVASHPQLYGKGKYSAISEHRPAAHQRYLEWTPSRIIRWAEQTGVHIQQKWSSTSWRSSYTLSKVTVLAWAYSGWASATRLNARRLLAAGQLP